ncbi:MAG: Fur family transcriptional regulator [Gemmatimonadota bacterium]
MSVLTKDESAALVERFRRHLRERRLPVTRQRLAVAEVVFSSDDHPSVDVLRRRLMQRGESVGLATLYRTLDALVASGMVREHDFGEGFKRYEGSVLRDQHEHLVCSRCAAVVEFVNDRLERMLRMTADEHHFVYERHRIEIHGICANCRRHAVEPFTPEPAR